jgi:hypothetical protein
MIGGKNTKKLRIIFLRRHDLVVSVLEVPLLALPYGIDELVFMEVENLPGFLEFRAEGQELMKRQNAARKNCSTEMTGKFVAQI